MTEVIVKQPNEPIVLAEVFFINPENSEVELSLEEASKVAARYMVAKAFSHGLRREGILLDIARHKTEPLDFVKSVRMLWGTGPTRRHEEIDEIDIMHKAYSMRLFDVIFPLPNEDTAEPIDESSLEDNIVEPNDEELLEIEQELHIARY